MPSTGKTGGFLWDWELEKSAEILSAVKKFCENLSEKLNKIESKLTLPEECHVIALPAWFIFLSVLILWSVAVV